MSGVNTALNRRLFSFLKVARGTF